MVDGFLNVLKSIAEFGRGRRNSSKCLARECKGGLAEEMRPCDEGVFKFREMRIESRWEGRERPIGKMGGTRARQRHGEGTSYECAVVHFRDPPGFVSAPSLKVDRSFTVWSAG